MIFVQAPNGVYSTSPAVTITYGSDNTAGNMGTCWCFCNAGDLPGSISDSNGNTWCFINAYQSNVGALCVFRCPKLAAGPNTVSATFGTLPSVPVSIHVEEWSYSGSASTRALQNCKQHNPFVTYDWGIAGSYTWGGPGIPIPTYYNPQSSGSQKSVTATLFLALYDFASLHGWGDAGTCMARSQTEQLGATASTVSGEYLINTGGTQKLFLPSFSIIYPPGPQVQPSNLYIGFMMVEI